MDYPKYSLHLFAGAGGGLLADIIGGETTPVCAVEIEKYPQQILAARFPDLAIWDDVRTFRAAAERAAAERAAAKRFELSPREIKLQKLLG